jgi:hypothetical protein
MKVIVCWIAAHIWEQWYSYEDKTHKAELYRCRRCSRKSWRRLPK